MYYYYNTRSKKFEDIKASKCAYKIRVDKERLRSSVEYEYMTNGNDHVYVANLDGHKFAFIEFAEVVKPEYAEDIVKVCDGDHFSYNYCKLIDD